MNFLSILAVALSACFAVTSLNAHFNEGLAIQSDPDPDPVSGLDVYHLSWFARENALYTLEASFDLRPPWFVVSHFPDASHPGLEENELVEAGFTTDAARLFFRVVQDDGIRLTAICEPGQGVLLELDASRWAARYGYYDSFEVVIERASDPAGPFSVIHEGYELYNHGYKFIDRSDSPSPLRYYRAWFSFVDGDYNTHSSPVSSLASADCSPAVAPNLTATNHSDRVVLNWIRPSWADWGTNIAIANWTLRRATSPAGPFQDVQIGWQPTIQTGMHVDTTVDPGVDYYYYIFFRYTDWDGSHNQFSARSSIIHAKTSPAPVETRPMDVVFIQDNTMSSVSNALNILKDPTPSGVLDRILDRIEMESGGNYRLALVTTDSNVVHVRRTLQPSNRQALKEGYEETPALPGDPQPEESTDECLRTVIYGLSASNRPSQTGDFFPLLGLDEYGGPAYGEDVNGNPVVPRKVIILITDALPGGFDDSYSSSVRNDVLSYISEARCRNIEINSILIGGYHRAVDLMIEYASISCGWFSAINPSPESLEAAVLNVFGPPIGCKSSVVCP